MASPPPHLPPPDLPLKSRCNSASGCGSPGPSRDRNIHQCTCLCVSQPPHFLRSSPDLMPSQGLSLTRALILRASDPFSA